MLILEILLTLALVGDVILTLALMGVSGKVAAIELATVELNDFTQTHELAIAHLQEVAHDLEQGNAQTMLEVFQQEAPTAALPAAPPATPANNKKKGVTTHA